MMNDKLLSHLGRLQMSWQGSSTFCNPIGTKLTYSDVLSPLDNHFSGVAAHFSHTARAGGRDIVCVILFAFEQGAQNTSAT